MKKYVVTADVRKHGYGFIDPKRFASTVSIVNNFFKPKTSVKVSDIYAPGFAPSPK